MSPSSSSAATNPISPTLFVTFASFLCHHNLPGVLCVQVLQSSAGLPRTPMPPQFVGCLATAPVASTTPLASEPTRTFYRTPVSRSLSSPPRLARCSPRLVGTQQRRRCHRHARGRAMLGRRGCYHRHRRAARPPPKPPRTLRPPRSPMGRTSPGHSGVELACPDVAGARQRRGRG